MEPRIQFYSNNIENIRAGELRAKWSAAGDRILRYYIDFRHTVLDLHKEVSAPEISILQNKVDTLLAGWDKKFLAYENKAQLTQGKELAETMTVEEEERREALAQILNHTLKIDDAVDWEILKDNSRFRPQPFEEPMPRKPALPTRPAAPDVGFFQALFGQRKRIEAEHAAKFAAFKAEYDRIEGNHKKAQSEWRERMDAWDAQQDSLKDEFYETQQETNSKVDALRQAWRNGEPEAIVEHVGIVLEASEYDDLVSKDFRVEYDAQTKNLIVDYVLPRMEDLPTVKTYRFIAKTGELKETQIAVKEKNALFDEVCYQVCLRTLHEIFEADEPENIASIVFNGSVDYIDAATGLDVHAVILSVMVSREDFLAINLARIEPKACFKSLKGVSASSLVGLTPIAPIMDLNRDDKRFVEGRAVELEDDGSTNLASMNWEEFEHLVRELFEKEFASRGGEVKVTQSSSDGGVDAVAFDPDPISGGKIIIQAKRYTKTVGVAAVRDLYGTTMNEGANKGILVTTADFGPDAHKFASDKPLTLMSGANLLHLLSKHGINAKIDIKEARKEMGLQ